MRQARGNGRWGAAALLLALVVAAGVWLAWSRHGASREMPRAVFLVVVDTLRPDRLSCYGCEAHETPAIDAFARSGVRFVQAEASASWTVPSVGSILTSRYPTQLGLTEKPADEGQTFQWREVRKQGPLRLPDQEETLSEILREAGFRTGAFVDQPGLVANDSFIQGFDDCYYPESPDEIRRYDPAQPLKGKHWPPFLARAGAIDDALIERFGGWLHEQDGKRVFAWIHLLTPHLPYVPPPNRMPPGRLDESAFQSSAFYDAEVVSVDGKFREILRLIGETVGVDRSLIVFTSDHGEAFGEHGMTEHGHTLHREVLHVPLVLEGPGLPERETVEGPVRTIDILPTIVDLAVGDEAIPERAEGRSLRSAIASGKAEDEVVYAEAMLYGSTERAWMEGGYKLMYDQQGNDYELFDVVADPEETRNLSREQPDRAEAMAQEMTALYRRLLRERVAGAHGENAEEEARAVEALKTLGYVK